MEEVEEVKINTIFFESLKGHVCEVLLPSDNIIETKCQLNQNTAVSNNNNYKNNQLLFSRQPKRTVQTVSSSTSYSIIISNDGHGWMIGNITPPNTNTHNNANSTANSSSYTNSYTYELAKEQTTQQIPRLLNNLPLISSVSTGKHHAFFLTKLGQIYSYGWDSHQKGILGVNGRICSEQPQIIQSLAAYRVILVSSSERHALALTESGKVFSWGDNSQGQLGISSNDTQSVWQPQQIDHFELYSCKSMLCLPSASIFLTKGGKLFLTTPQCNQKSHLQDNRPNPIIASVLKQITPDSIGNKELFFSDIVSNGDIAVCLTVFSELFIVDVRNLIWKQLNNQHLNRIESLNASNTAFFALSQAEMQLLEYDIIKIKAAIPGENNNNIPPEPQIYALNQQHLEVCQFASPKESTKVALTYKIRPFKRTCSQRNTSYSISNLSQSRLFEQVSPLKQDNPQRNQLNMSIDYSLIGNTVVDNSFMDAKSQRVGRHQFNQPYINNTNNCQTLHNNNRFETNFTRKTYNNHSSYEISNRPFSFDNVINNSINNKTHSNNNYIPQPLDNISRQQIYPMPQIIGQKEQSVLDGDKSELHKGERQITQQDNNSSCMYPQKLKESNNDCNNLHLNYLNTTNNQSNNLLHGRVASQDIPKTSQTEGTRLFCNSMNASCIGRQHNNNNKNSMISMNFGNYNITSATGSLSSSKTLNFWDQWHATQGRTSRTKQEIEHFIDLIYSGYQLNRSLNETTTKEEIIQRKDIERALKELETLEKEKNDNLEQERHEIKRYIEESKRALSNLHMKQKIFEERLDRQDIYSNSSNSYCNTNSNNTASTFRALESLQSEMHSCNHNSNNLKSGMKWKGNLENRRILDGFSYCNGLDGIGRDLIKKNNSSKSANHSYDGYVQSKGEKFYHPKLIKQSGNSMYCMKQKEQEEGDLDQEDYYSINRQRCLTKGKGDQFVKQKIVGFAVPCEQQEQAQFQREKRFESFMKSRVNNNCQNNLKGKNVIKKLDQQDISPCQVQEEENKEESQESQQCQEIGSEELDQLVGMSSSCSSSNDPDNPRTSRIIKNKYLKEEGQQIFKSQQQKKNVQGQQRKQNQQQNQNLIIEQEKRDYSQKWTSIQQKQQLNSEDISAQEQTSSIEEQTSSMEGQTSSALEEQDNQRQPGQTKNYADDRNDNARNEMNCSRDRIMNGKAKQGTVLREAQKQNVQQIRQQPRRESIGQIEEMKNNTKMANISLKSINKQANSANGITCDSNGIALCLRLEKLLLTRKSYVMRKLYSQKFMQSMQLSGQNADKEEFQRRLEKQKKQQKEINMKLIDAGMAKIDLVFGNRQKQVIQKIRQYQRDKDDERNRNFDEEISMEQVELENDKKIQNQIRQEEVSGSNINSLMIKEGLKQLTKLIEIADLRRAFSLIKDGGSEEGQDKEEKKQQSNKSNKMKEKSRELAGRRKTKRSLDDAKGEEERKYNEQEPDKLELQEQLEDQGESQLPENKRILSQGQDTGRRSSLRFIVTAIRKSKMSLTKHGDEDKDEYDDDDDDDEDDDDNDGKDGESLDVSSNSNSRETNARMLIGQEDKINQKGQFNQADSRIISKNNEDEEKNDGTKRVLAGKTKRNSRSFKEEEQKDALNDQNSIQNRSKDTVNVLKSNKETEDPQREADQRIKDNQLSGLAGVDLDEQNNNNDSLRNYSGYFGKEEGEDQNQVKQIQNNPVKEKNKLNTGQFDGFNDQDNYSITQDDQKQSINQKRQSKKDNDSQQLNQMTNEQSNNNNNTRVLAAAKQKVKLESFNDINDQQDGTFQDDKEVRPPPPLIDQQSHQSMNVADEKEGTVQQLGIEDFPSFQKEQSSTDLQQQEDFFKTKILSQNIAQTVKQLIKNNQKKNAGINGTDTHEIDQEEQKDKISSNAEIKSGNSFEFDEFDEKNAKNVSSNSLKDQDQDKQIATILAGITKDSKRKEQVERQEENKSHGIGDFNTNIITQTDSKKQNSKSNTDMETQNITQTSQKELDQYEGLSPKRERASPLLRREIESSPISQRIFNSKIEKDSAKKVISLVTEESSNSSDKDQSASSSSLSMPKQQDDKQEIEDLKKQENDMNVIDSQDKNVLFTSSGKPRARAAPYKKNYQVSIQKEQDSGEDDNINNNEEDQACEQLAKEYVKNLIESVLKMIYEKTPDPREQQNPSIKGFSSQDIEPFTIEELKLKARDPSNSQYFIKYIESQYFDRPSLVPQYTDDTTTNMDMEVSKDSVILERNEQPKYENSHSIRQQKSKSNNTSSQIIEYQISSQSNNQISQMNMRTKRQSSSASNSFVVTYQNVSIPQQQQHKEEQQQQQYQEHQCVNDLKSEKCIQTSPDRIKVIDQHQDSRLKRYSNNKYSRNAREYPRNVEERALEEYSIDQQSRSYRLSKLQRRLERKKQAQDQQQYYSFTAYKQQEEQQQKYQRYRNCCDNNSRKNSSFIGQPIIISQTPCIIQHESIKSLSYQVAATLPSSQKQLHKISQDNNVPNYHRSNNCRKNQILDERKQFRQQNEHSLIKEQEQHDDGSCGYNNNNSNNANESAKINQSYSIKKIPVSDRSSQVLIFSDSLHQETGSFWNSSLVNSVFKQENYPQQPIQMQCQSFSNTDNEYCILNRQVNQSTLPAANNESNSQQKQISFESYLQSLQGKNRISNRSSLLSEQIFQRTQSQKQPLLAMQKDEIDESIIMNDNNNNNNGHYSFSSFLDKKHSKYDSFIGWLTKNNEQQQQEQAGGTDQELTQKRPHSAISTFRSRGFPSAIQIPSAVSKESINSSSPPSWQPKYSELQFDLKKNESSQPYIFPSVSAILNKITSSLNPLEADIQKKYNLGYQSSNSVIGLASPIPFNDSDNLNKDNSINNISVKQSCNVSPEIEQLLGNYPNKCLYNFYDKVGSMQKQPYYFDVDNFDAVAKKRIEDVKGKEDIQGVVRTNEKIIESKFILSGCSDNTKQDQRSSIICQESDSMSQYKRIKLLEEQSKVRLQQQMLIQQGKQQQQNQSIYPAHSYNFNTDNNNNTMNQNISCCFEVSSRPQLQQQPLQSTTQSLHAQIPLHQSESQCSLIIIPQLSQKNLSDYSINKSMKESSIRSYRQMKQDYQNMHVDSNSFSSYMRLPQDSFQIQISPRENESNITRKNSKSEVFLDMKVSSMFQSQQLKSSMIEQQDTCQQPSVVPSLKQCPGNNNAS